MTGMLAEVVGGNKSPITVGAKHFLCGCSTEPRTGYENTKRRDEANFLVCPEHGYRECGWRNHIDKQRGLVR